MEHEGGSAMKSVLVIDTPERCEDCPCAYFTEGATSDYCRVTDSDIEDGMLILEDCPLKKLPQIRPCNYYDFEHYTSGYDKGWNDCIEHILPKEKEEKKNNADGDGRL